MKSIIYGNNNNYISAGNKSNILILSTTSSSISTSSLSTPISSEVDDTNNAIVSLINNSKNTITVYYYTNLSDIKFENIDTNSSKTISIPAGTYKFRVNSNYNNSDYIATFKDYSQNINEKYTNGGTNPSITLVKGTTYNIIIKLTKPSVTGVMVSPKSGINMIGNQYFTQVTLYNNRFSNDIIVNNALSVCVFIGPVANNENRVSVTLVYNNNTYNMTQINNNSYGLYYYYNLSSPFSGTITVTATDIPIYNINFSYVTNKSITNMAIYVFDANIKPVIPVFFPLTVEKTLYNLFLNSNVKYLLIGSLFLTYGTQLSKDTYPPQISITPDYLTSYIETYNKNYYVWQNFYANSKDITTFSVSGKIYDPNGTNIFGTKYFVPPSNYTYVLIEKQ